MMYRFHSKIFIFRPVSAVRPYSESDNLRGTYHTISGYNMSEMVYLPTIKSLLWNWRIIYPTFHHDELPLYR